MRAMLVLEPFSKTILNNAPYTVSTGGRGANTTIEGLECGGTIVVHHASRRDGIIWREEAGPHPLV